MQPQKYERTTDFTERDGDDTDHASINAEFDAAALTTDQIRENLALIQRDDGALKNGIVTADALDDTAFDAVLVNVNVAVNDAQTSAASALTSATTALAARDVTLAAKSTTETARDVTILNANNASASALAALNSQNAAATSQSDAAASKVASASSQVAAAASATSAATSATTATTQAGIATTKAADSAASATASASSAAGSQTAKTASETARDGAQTARSGAEAARDTAVAAKDAAQVSQSAASSSASSAGTSATTATTKAAEASASATSAANSATTATTQATTATTKATEAAASAASALASKNAAATSEANAAASQVSAANSAAAAATALDNFDDRYLGPKASAPTLDNDGNALLIGALYFNTTTNAMQVYGSSGWTAAGSSVNGTSRRFEYVATAGQTTFTGADSLGNTLAYDAGYVDVYLNGARLKSNDFTASSGTSIVLAVAAALNDELNIVAFGTFVLADHYDKTAADARFVNAAGDTMTGALVVQQSISATSNDSNFAVGGRRAVMDLWAAGNRARVGSVNGGGSAVGLTLLSNGLNAVDINTAGLITMQYQPYAAWSIWCVTPSNTRTYAVRSNVGGNATGITAPQGSNPGYVIRFTAPIAGRYLVTVQAFQAGTNSPTGGASSCLISAFGAWDGNINSIAPSQEIIDTRSARGVDDLGSAFVLNLAQGDHIEPDFYTAYESGGRIDVTVHLLS